MPKVTIEVEVEEISCCVCARKAQLTPVALVFEPPYHDTTVPPRWLVQSRIYPAGWNHFGQEMLCPGCWKDLLDFVASRRPSPSNP